MALSSLMNALAQIPLVTNSRLGVPIVRPTVGDPTRMQRSRVSQGRVFGPTVLPVLLPSRSKGQRVYRHHGKWQLRKPPASRKRFLNRSTAKQRVATVGAPRLLDPPRPRSRPGVSPAPVAAPRPSSARLDPAPASVVIPRPDMHESFPLPAGVDGIVAPPPRASMDLPACPSCAWAPGNALSSHSASLAMEVRDFVLCPRCGGRLREQGAFAAETDRATHPDFRVDALAREAAATTTVRKTLVAKFAAFIRKAYDIPEPVGDPPAQDSFQRDARTVLRATPRDVATFLGTFNDSGQQIAHRETCSMMARVAQDPALSCKPRTGVPRTCDCPVVQSAKTLEKNLFTLRAAFRDMGRSAPWCPTDLTGNPVNSALVKTMFAGFQSQLAKSRVISTPAPRVTQDYVFALLRGVLRAAGAPGAAQQDIERHLRTALLFSCLWFLGLRHSDAERLQWHSFSVHESFPAALPGLQEASLAPSDGAEQPPTGVVHLDRTKTRREAGQGASVYWPAPLGTSTPMDDPVRMSPPAIWRALELLLGPTALREDSCALMLPTSAGSEGVSRVRLTYHRAVSLLTTWRGRLSLGHATLHSFHGNASRYAAPDGNAPDAAWSAQLSALALPLPGPQVTGSADAGGSRRALLAMHWSAGTQRHYHHGRPRDAADATPGRE